MLEDGVRGGEGRGLSVTRNYANMSIPGEGGGEVAVSSRVELFDTTVG